MGTPHKHAALIKAWADGAQIQLKTEDGRWHDASTPSWNPKVEYRVKPEPVVLKYRRFITASGYGGLRGVYCLQYDSRDRYKPETEPGFVRWIDNDWITETIEEV